MNLKKLLGPTAYLILMGLLISWTPKETTKSQDDSVSVTRDSNVSPITVQDLQTTLMVDPWMIQLENISAPSTTTILQSPRETIPLTEAKNQGLWGRPTFEGCTSKYGTESPEWLGELFSQSSWPVEAWPKLCRVIGCESNFHPDSYGGLRDKYGPRMMGLLQIDRRSWTSKWQSMGFTDMFDPLQNLEFGFWLYTTTRDNGDWNSWPGDQWTCNRA